MSCKQLVVVLFAISGCRDRCELPSATAPASKAIESMTREPPASSAGEAAEPEEPPVPDRPPAPPLPRAQLAPAPVEPRRPVTEAPPRQEVVQEQRPLPPPPEPPRQPAPAPAPRTYVEVHVPPAPVQVMPTTQPQYNDAGVLVPAVPLWIDPSAPPGTPGNGAPDPNTTGER